jgi:hypothetical protein
MLEATRMGMSGIDIEVKANGTALAMIEGSFWGNSASVIIDGRQYHFRRDGWHSIVLTEAEDEVAEATQHLLHQSWTVTLPGRMLLLEPDGAPGRAYRVTDDGAVVGDVIPGAAWPRGVKGLTANLSHDLPHPVQMLILYVMLSFWRRRRLYSLAVPVKSGGRFSL